MPNAADEAFHAPRRENHPFPAPLGTLWAKTGKSLAE